MRFSFHDDKIVTSTAIKKGTTALAQYTSKVETTLREKNKSSFEYSLAHVSTEQLHDTLEQIKKDFPKLKRVVLIGIGGSSLGVEAVHAVLDEGKVTLSVIDTVSAYDISKLQKELLSVKKVDDIAVCVVSKSGGTTETIVNAAIVLDALKSRFGDVVLSRTIFIGDAGTDFIKYGKKNGVTVVTMPAAIGGRFSVGTEVALVPLSLLGHDIDSFIEGFVDAGNEDYERVVAESAARLFVYTQKNYTHYNFFAFEKRLETLGKWYRQLLAESIGKSTDRAGKAVSKGFVPTISTPVELHSIGQLYLSGFKGVYTDFVTFDDECHDFKIPKVGLGKKFSRFSIQEVATALYGGVVGAYNDAQLPYRATIFDEQLAYSLGLFMAMRMRETMYLAELMNLNAFDQPHVELYKTKTKTILGL